MIKGIFLSIFASIFIVSLILTISGISGHVQPNPITGSVIGPSQLVSYSAIALVVSFILGVFVVRLIRKNN